MICIGFQIQSQTSGTTTEIRTREQLAQHSGMSRATIYRFFDADWSGTATLTVLVRMACCFRAPAALVKEPARAA